MLCTCQTFKSPHVLSSLMIFKFKTRIDVKKCEISLKRVSNVDISQRFVLTFVQMGSHPVYHLELSPRFLLRHSVLMFCISIVFCY